MAAITPFPYFGRIIMWLMEKMTNHEVKQAFRFLSVSIALPKVGVRNLRLVFIAFRDSLVGSRSRIIKKTDAEPEERDRIAVSSSSPSIPPPTSETAPIHKPSSNPQVPTIEQKGMDRQKEMDLLSKRMKAEFGVIRRIVKRLDYYEPFTTGENNEDWLENTVLSFAKGKAERKGVRGYFAWKCFHYLVHDHEKLDAPPNEIFETKLPLLFEMIIAVQYLHNQILDEKYGVSKSDSSSINETLLQANLLKDVLDIYLEENIFPNLDLDKQKYIKSKIRFLYMHVDHGQTIDTTFNNFAHWRDCMERPTLLNVKEAHFLLEEENRNCMDRAIEEVYEDLSCGHDFTRLYFHRIFLTSALFFQIVVDIVSALLPTSKEKSKDELRKFALYYGMMLQLINDYSDYAFSEDENEMKNRATAAKSAEDAFADLYNFNVTLPLIFHLQWKYNRRIEQYLQEQKKEKEGLMIYGRQIMQEILMGGGIRKTQALSLRLAKAAEQCLDKNNPVSSNIRDMCGIAYDNKFLVFFVKENPQY